MKNKYTLFLVLIQFYCHAQQSSIKLESPQGPITVSQEVIELKEVDRKNKIFYVNKPNRSFPAVDINSTIVIILNKSMIRSSAANLIKFRFPIPEKKIAQIEKLLLQEQVVLSTLQFNNNETLVQRSEKLRQFSQSMGSFLDTLIATYPSGTREREQLNNILSQAELSMYGKIYTFIRSEMTVIDQALQQAIDSNKVYFRLGGWLKNKYGTHPIHIPEFDIHEENQFFEVPTLVTAIPREELERFQQFQQLAKNLNDRKKDLLNSFRDELNNNTGSLIDFLDSKVITKLTNTQDSVPADKLKDDIKKPISAIKDQVTKLRSALANLQLAASDSTTFSFLAKVNTSFQEVSIQITPTIKVLQDQKHLLSNALVDIDMNTVELKKNLDDAENKIGQLRNQLLPIITALTSLPNESALRPNSNSLTFGEEVSKLVLDNLPDSTILDLRTTGFRENDDELYLKATLGKQINTALDVNEKTIYYKRISLYQISMYSTAKAVLLFTDNVNSSFVNKKQFQINPSYSILFKWGSRRYLFYNKYLSPGIGLNLSTLDFDNDGTPEVGLGIVGSIFQDYVQVGLGRDLAVGNNYWFFGLRLPLLGINFGGAQQTDIQAKD